MAADTRNVLLAEGLKGERLNRLDRSRLLRDKANDAVIDKWLREYPAKYPNLRLVLWHKEPDEYAQVYCDTFMQFVREMPSEHEDDRPWTMSVAEFRDREAVRRAP